MECLIEQNNLIYHRILYFAATFFEWLQLHLYGRWEGLKFCQKNVTSFMDRPWRGRSLRIGDDHQGLRGWAFSPFGKGPHSKPVLGVGSCKGNEPFIKIKPSSSGHSSLWFGKGPCSKSAFVWCRGHETKDLSIGVSKLISFISIFSTMSILQLLFQNLCKLWHI